jgi:hypothetical protein
MHAVSDRRRRVERRQASHLGDFDARSYEPCRGGWIHSHVARASRAEFADKKAAVRCFR